jgi:hypothetical protein
MALVKLSSIHLGVRFTHDGQMKHRVREKSERRNERAYACETWTAEKALKSLDGAQVYDVIKGNIDRSIAIRRYN